MVTLSVSSFLSHDVVVFAFFDCGSRHGSFCVQLFNSGPCCGLLCIRLFVFCPHVQSHRWDPHVDVVTYYARDFNGFEADVKGRLAECASVFVLLGRRDKSPLGPKKVDSNSSVRRFSGSAAIDQNHYGHIHQHILCFSISHPTGGIASWSGGIGGPLRVWKRPTQSCRKHRIDSTTTIPNSRTFRRRISWTLGTQSIRFGMIRVAGVTHADIRTGISIEECYRSLTKTFKKKEKRNQNSTRMLQHE